MFKRSTHKIRERHTRRDHKRPAAASPSETPTASWLPDRTADYAAWGAASDTAKQEFDTAWENWRRRMGDASLNRIAHEARQLWLYTLERVYPPGFWEGMAEMFAGSTENIEMYIAFLEADPRFHRSGYAKSHVIRGVKRLPLNPQQKYRLQQVVLHVVDKGFRIEFRDYCRLARYVQSTEFLLELEERMLSSDADRAARARWVREACVKK